MPKLQCKSCGANHNFMSDVDRFVCTCDTVNEVDPAVAARIAADKQKQAEADAEAAVKAAEEAKAKATEAAKAAQAKAAELSTPETVAKEVKDEGAERSVTAEETKTPLGFQGVNK